MAVLRARVALRLATAAAGLLNHRGLPVAPDPGRDGAMPTRALVLATLLLMLAPAVAQAQKPRPEDWGFQVRADTTGRTFEDASLIQFSMRPPLRADIVVRGHELEVAVDGVTLTGLASTAKTLKTAHRTGLPSGVFVDRRLRPGEARRWKAKPVWIDGDVLLVNPANPLCAGGATLGAVRERLKTAATGPLLVPTGLFGAEEQLFDLHPPAGRESGYAPVAKAVAEWQAISAVASDPAAIAAVAWSAARGRLEGGSVCAVPLDGVAPTEATLRDGTYPATVPVSFAWDRKPRFGRPSFPGFQRRWYFRYLRSAAVREILLTGRGRERLLP